MAKTGTLHRLVSDYQMPVKQVRVRKSAAALLLSSHIGQRFDAFVTGASPKGTWVRISRPAAEGKLVRGFHGLEVGDRVRVELIHTDFEHGFIDFARS